ncbi:3-hydroxyacyl-CoA dehydrogenase NAD-binding domain-containing protein [Xanthobacter sp. 126]|uniref:3-hydroxyacyl-CoA dehydrogenase NAD-binding domain-containing protein n=1 Tax=Xanthobacter sp. 126 TaxID=1131814 RepID=UPI00045EA22C|nr:3-hydroxyacyl-CoA dehydrogenase NAD-binding domain-containing protein [Xanthobacter sp. 126]
MVGRAMLVRDGEIAVLRIDNPPVNALSRDTLTDMARAFEAFEADASFTALVITCAGRTFVSGGDIAAFADEAFSTKPFNTLLERIEASPRPVVAALFGTVLGGGLELALACHFRVAAPATRLGLPEISLGLLPGSLGTQRLPRLTGVKAACRLISSGAPISAGEAGGIGLVDQIADDVSGASREAALALAAEAGALRRASTLAVPDAQDVAAVLEMAREEAARRPHLPALSGLERCLDAAVRLPFAEGDKVEAETFRALLKSPQSRALRHLFFAERAAQRIPDLPADTALRPIQKVGIVGVGTMGGGIAMAFADAGFPVTLVETSQEALDHGTGLIARSYTAAVTRGKLTEREAAARFARTAGSTGFRALADVDLVIEAVFEDLQLKLDVAEKLGRACKPGAIIATNTSTLDVDRIAAASGRPADVLGTHFFSPAHIMRLLEIVRGTQTAPDTLATVLKLARTIGKTAVVSGVCYGFIGNRMAEVYGRESEALQLEGASPAQIDGVAESPRWLGMAMGPSRMLDMAGVDVGARTVIEWIASGAGPRDPAYRAMCRTLFATGDYGQKTGKGYYQYDGRRAVPCDDTTALAIQLAQTHGIRRRPAISEQEIFERLLYPMVNEAAQILDEGIAYRPGDIDVVWTAGYGFPSWRGGPVFMADEIGLPTIVERLDHYAQTLGNAHGYWSVSPLLRRLAAQGRRLTDWRRS